MENVLSLSSDSSNVELSSEYTILSDRYSCYSWFVNAASRLMGND